MSGDVEGELATTRRRGIKRLLIRVFAGMIVVYLLVAYLALPFVWRRSEARHPALEGMPRISRTHDGIPGDPLNVAFIGGEKELLKTFLAARWHAADAITFRSSVRIAEGTLLRRPDDDAPVSNLYVWGKKQDLAFEQPVGDNPRQRHHVRFWRSEKLDDQGRPLWIGGATYDTKVGFSHTTGQITHHISADVDAERDKIVSDCQEENALTDLIWLLNFQRVLQGRNGGGDPYHTDGRLPIGWLDPVK